MKPLHYYLITVVLLFSANVVNANRIDKTLIETMSAYHVPVVGYAIINRGKIVAAKTISIDSHIRVTQHSLFQAASISKSVSAYGFLTMVVHHKIGLTTPANKWLKSWKIAKNPYNENHPVTLKEILNMTSGLSVSGYAGYKQGLPLPTNLEILEGRRPANSAPVNVFYTPGSKYFYSGGSYQVLQQIMTDQSGMPFSTFMMKQVLKPIGMHDSIYQYPLSKKLRAKAVPGFWLNGKMLHGGWNNYAIAASGGLWSTPTDIAKFALNVTQAYEGKKTSLIRQPLAKQMLTRGHHTSFGLGVVVNGHGKSLNFRKNGHNFGYHNQMLMFPNTGQGIVMMTDSENGMEVINYMMPVIAHHYNMPAYFPFFDELMPVPTYT